MGVDYYVKGFALSRCYEHSWSPDKELKLVEVPTIAIIFKIREAR